MFVNLSNHPSEKWAKEQYNAALNWGEVKDYPFPHVEAGASEDEINYLADKITCEIVRMSPDIVMCQGEFTLSYAIISRLKTIGVNVVAACSQRQAYETVMEDGTISKVSSFIFVQFREY